MLFKGSKIYMIIHCRVRSGKRLATQLVSLIASHLKSDQKAAFKFTIVPS